MPKITVSQVDIDRSKPPDKGWHLATIQDIDEKPSKDKGSINTAVQFKIDSSEKSLGIDSNKDRYAAARFNSKGNPAGWLPLFSSALDIPIAQLEKEVGNGTLELDSDALIKKQLWIEITDRIFEGKIMKEIANYAPNSVQPF